jgi:hypothetical protein
MQATARRVVEKTKQDCALIDSLTSPGSSYARKDPNSPWDALQVGYFLSYGMWNYLTTPFLLRYPGASRRRDRLDDESLRAGSDE